MATKWVKAVFLFIIGILLTLYGDKFVSDLEDNFSDQVAFDATWTLLTILIWVLVAWLFVDGVLIIVLSFSEQRYTLSDVMKRLDVIEKKLGIKKLANAKGLASELESTDEEVEHEEPPPPRE
jgi:hypothetical protein